MSNWAVETVEGPATLLHRGSEALLAPGSGLARPLLRVLKARRDAVVLGSSQPYEHLDARRVAAAGLEVVRRRSGGAAVLVGPAHGLWVDLLVPSTSTAWRADVSHAAWWVGERWAEALSVSGVACVESGAGVATGNGRGSLEVWRAGIARRAWSDRVCFAGLGPGEVTLDGQKLVGMSQRRTRQAALFQCALVYRWQPRDLLDVLAVTEFDRERASRDLCGAAAVLPARCAPALIAALVRCLEAATGSDAP